MSMLQKLKDTHIGDLIKIIQHCKSRTEVLQQFGFKGNDPRARKYLTTIIEDHSIGTEHFEERQFKGRLRYNIDDVVHAVKTSTCMTEVLRKLNLSDVGGNGNTIKKIITKYNISTSHFTRKRSSFKPKHNPNNVLTENSTLSRSVLRRLVIRESIIDYKCYKCGNEGSWMGAPITLDLDHINGIRNDNRPTNLRFACPNCHSQTSTFRGKNKC